ncbi:hypothetical protein ACVGXO_17440, partial [Enterobacter hormaechei]
LRFRSITVQTVSAFYLRCGLRFPPCISRGSSGCRIGTAKQSPRRDKQKTMTTAYRFMHRHTRNTLVARGWPPTIDKDMSLIKI